MLFCIMLNYLVLYYVNLLCYIVVCAKILAS